MPGPFLGGRNPRVKGEGTANPPECKRITRLGLPLGQDQGCNRNGVPGVRLLVFASNPVDWRPFAVSTRLRWP